MRVFLCCVLIGLSALFAAPRFFIGLLLCGNEVFATHPIPGTAWIIEERGAVCAFEIGGRLPDELVAVNWTTNERVHLAKGAFSDISFAPGQVVLTLPNRSMQNPIGMMFDGIRVVVRYTPVDDPVDRAAYQAWVHDRLDPASRHWYCSSVFPNLSSRDQKDNNAVYSPDVGSGPNSPRPYDDKGNLNEHLSPYCPAP